MPVHTTKHQSTAKQRRSLKICGASAEDPAALLDDNSQFYGVDSDDGGDSSDSKESEDSDVPTEKQRCPPAELQR